MRNGRGPKTANKYFQKAADAGVVQAMLDLGNNYLDGTGIKQDTAMAVEYDVVEIGIFIRARGAVYTRRDIRRDGASRLVL